MEPQQQPQAPAAPEAPARDPQELIESIHNDMGELLEVAKAEAPESAAKLEALMGQYEAVIAEIAQGGGQEQPQKDPGQVAGHAGAAGVPMSPEV